jgi:hypothetical protein
MEDARVPSDGQLLLEHTYGLRSRTKERMVKQAGTRLSPAGSGCGGKRTTDNSMQVQIDLSIMAV